MQEIVAHVQALGYRVVRAEGDNPTLRRTRIPFTWPKHGCPGLRSLRRRFDFASVVTGEDEFQDYLRLGHWVHTHLTRRGRPAATGDPIEILRLSQEKRAAFWCSHFAIVYTACAAALGLPVRELAIDCLHVPGEDSVHHGVNEAYSTALRKWFALDAMHDCYFVKDGVPLNANELAGEWVANQGADVQVKRFTGETVPHSGYAFLGSRHDSCAYYYHYTPLTIDPFPSAGDAGPERALYFEDEERRRNTWYQGSAANPYPHVNYGGAFLPTDRLDDFYFDVNLVHLVTRPLPARKALAVSFSTFTPNLSHFLYRINDGPWRRFSGRRPWKEAEAAFFDDGAKTVDQPTLRQREVLWRLRPGRNSFAARPVNRFGREGGVSRVEVWVA